MMVNGSFRRDGRAGGGTPTRHKSFDTANTASNSRQFLLSDSPSGVGGNARTNVTQGHSTPPNRSLPGSEVPSGLGGTPEGTPQRSGGGANAYNSNSFDEHQPLVGSLHGTGHPRRTTSQLSTGSAQGGFDVNAARVPAPRRLPTPRDPRRGGVQYFSTRKSPRTSNLDMPSQPNFN